MPGLLTLKTDLKSLKYGQDQPGGGNSGQPYIKTDINTVDDGAINKLRFTKFDDGFIRGGAVGTANAAIVDTIRIGKFLTDAPQGPLFIAKQVGLQLSNPQLEAKEVKTNRPTSGQGFITNAINFIANTAGKIENAVGPTRIYNLGINTLAQVPVNALGGHIVRHGFLPERDESKDYINVVRTNAGLDNNSVDTATEYNRLLNLSNNLNLGPWGDNKFGVTKKEQGTINKVIGQLGGLITSPIGSTILGGIVGLLNTNKELEISNYIAGPGSVYGIGNTIIRRAMDGDTENKEKIELSLEQSGQYAGKTRDKDNNIQEVDYQSSTLYAEKGPSSYPALPDFTKPTNIYSGAKTYADIANTNGNTNTDRLQNISNLIALGQGLHPMEFTSSNQFKIINTDGTGKPEMISGSIVFSSKPLAGGVITYKNSYNEVVTIKKSTWNKASRAVRVGSGRTDSINLTPLFNGTSGQDSLVVKIGGEYYTINDLVKFRIEAINTDDPKQSTFMVFRAYITSFDDSTTANWDATKYIGRGEDFYIYNGFSRKINIGFKVAALSAAEMKPMYQKLNYLMSNLMPDYGNGVFMRGPMTKMTVGNWIDSQPGVINNLSYTVSNDSPWEIALNEPTTGGSPEMVLPHIIDVSLSFTPIGVHTKHEYQTPQKSSEQSNIAQNWNGDSGKEPNYIGGAVAAGSITGSVEYGDISATPTKLY